MIEKDLDAAIEQAIGRLEDDYKNGRLPLKFQGFLEHMEYLDRGWARRSGLFDTNNWDWNAYNAWFRQAVANKELSDEQLWEMQHKDPYTNLEVVWPVE